jgi:cysteine synthase A
MGRIYNNIVETVGRTPLVRLNKIPASAGLDPSTTIALKCEFFNPLGSVKDRIGMSMIEDAEKSGVTQQGYRHHRADERQYRHCARIRRRGEGLQAHSHHA